MKNSTAVFATSLIITLMACNKEKESSSHVSSTPDPEYFEFIKTGHRSVYDLKETFADPSVPYGMHKSIRTINTEQGDGKYKMVDSTFFENNLDTIIFTSVWHKDTSAWSMVDGEKNTLILKSHPIEGETTYQVWNKDTILCTVISVKETVTIPLGTFECVKVHMHGPYYSVTYDAFVYYNFKYGIIKQETVYYDSKEQKIYTHSQIMSGKNF